MSPEQAEGKQVDARSDIFSFGAVLYEMVTGQRAFEGDSDISTLTAVLRDDVKPVAEMIPDVPAELDHVIKVCLTKDPDARWQSMREVEMALSGLKRRSDAGVLHKRPGSPPSTPPGSAVQSPISHLPPPAPKSNKRIGLAIAAVAGFIILAGAAAAGWWWTKHRTVAPSPAAIAQAPEVSKPSAISSQPAPTPVPPPSAPETPAPSASVPTQAPSPYATPPRATPSPVPPVIAPPAAPAATPAVTPATAPVPAPAVPRAPGRTVPIDVADGLPFRIALAEDVPANAEEEKALSFRVMEPLKVGDTVLVPRGAVVTGSIASEGGKRFLGLGAKMTFQLDSVDAVDGQKLKVRAAPARKPSGPTTRPIDTGKYAKAKDLAAARGTDYIAYVDGNQTISVRK
jgi:serine/threonine-protein kinase